MSEDIVVSPVLYALLYRQMADAAKGLGYALAIHGSLVRDCDVVAVPWTDDAVPAYELIDALARVVGEPLGSVAGSGVEKPHGRRVWGIVPIGGNEYIDLSVMPRDADYAALLAAATEAARALRDAHAAMESAAATGLSLGRSDFDAAIRNGWSALAALAAAGVRP